MQERKSAVLNRNYSVCLLCKAWSVGMNLKEHYALPRVFSSESEVRAVHRENSS